MTSVHVYTDARILYKECRSLAMRGYEVHLIAPTAPDEMWNGIYLHGLSAFPSNRLFRITLGPWIMLLRATSIKAQVYHFHDPELLLTGLALRLLGREVIYDIHEDVPKQIENKLYLPPFSRGIIKRFVDGLELIIAKRMSGLVFVSDRVGRRFSAMSVPKTIVVNYPDLSEFEGFGESKYADKDYVATYTGNISIKRGAIEIVRAMGYITSTSKPVLELAGKWHMDSKDLIDLPGWEYVRMRGFLQRPELLELLSRARLGIHIPKPDEHFQNAIPTKLFEYMAASIPVIVSDIPILRAFVDGAGCGICVDPNSPREIGEAIDYLFANADEAEDMGRRGRESVMSTYQWKHESKKLISFYKSILS